jgi:hypothetical protein
VSDAACSLPQTLCYNRAPFQQQFQRSFKISRARQIWRTIIPLDRLKDQEEQ